MKKMMFGIALMASQLLISEIAHAELSISPHRIVLDETDRAATLTLMNRGADPETYRIYWVYRRMTETLGIEAAANADEVGTDDAAAIIRYAPRQVTLMPGESQTVRLLVRRPADMAEGEYRAHLMFEREPELISGYTTGESELSLKVHVAYGITIPVIVRHGTAVPVSAVLETALELGGGAIEISLQREGPHSLYGQLRALHVVGGEETLLATIPNFAVYSEVDAATRRLPLQWPSGEQSRNGEIRVELIDAEAERLIARDTLALR